jgi:hypothetical protein
MFAVYTRILCRRTARVWAARVKLITIRLCIRLDKKIASASLTILIIVRRREAYEAVSRVKSRQYILLARVVYIIEVDSIGDICTYCKRQYRNDSFYLCCLSRTSTAVKQGHTGHLPLLDDWREVVEVLSGLRWAACENVTRVRALSESSSTCNTASSRR